MNTFRIRGALLRGLCAAPALAAAFALATSGPPAAEGPASPVTSVESTDWGMEFYLDRGSAGLWQTLKRLHTRASVMMVTAHPDDEDGGMLASESRGRGTRASLLCVTRGEGGANVMSHDYFDALGLVRTEELLAANRYYGVEQYWTRVIDYGFSKTKEEALEKWGRDRLLCDAVRAVRLARPLVITSVFIGGATDGHGNHQAVGQLAQELYAAAADPNAFPDQIKEGLRPWAPAKTYGRVPLYLMEGRVDPKGLYNYATGKWEPAGSYNYIDKKWTPGALQTNVEIPEGDYDPLFGLNYVQIAREGLGQQKCQTGGASIPQTGEMKVAYHRFGSRVNSGARESSYFDGIDVSLGGIADLAGSADAGFLRQGLAQINSLVEKAMQDFSAQQPERVAPTLASGLKAANALIDQVAASSLPDQAKYDVTHELKVKAVQFNTALGQALGLTMQATVAPGTPVDPRLTAFMGTPATFRVAIPGQQFSVNLHINNQSGVPVQFVKAWLQNAEGDPWSSSMEGQAPPTLVSNKPANLRFKVGVPAKTVYTRPYYSRPDIEQAYYDILDARWLNRSQRPYPLAAWVELSCEGVPIRIGQSVQSVERITGPGTVLYPLVTGPAISVTISPRLGVVPLGARAFTLTVNIHSNVKGPAKGELRLQLPQGWTSVPPAAPFATARDGEDQSVTLQVQPSALQEKAYKITAVANYGGQEFKEGYDTAGYAGLRPYNLYEPSTYGTSGVDVKVTPSLTVGYIMGSGDEVPESMGNLGINVNFMSDQDIAGGDLSKYRVILLGVRTYAARPILKTYNGRLLDYVKNGGVLIIQYNTQEFDQNFGPYPCQMTQNAEEVTYEDSPVRILAPENPVFNWPNKITPKDFQGWVEERGSKFMTTWDPHYQALLETHDPNQEPQKGGLLYAQYGKGIYIYCAYAFYRQLPEGVPGAYRLFANLVSLPDNPQVKAAAGK